jgi:hypothetical protein
MKTARKHSDAVTWRRRARPTTTSPLEAVRGAVRRPWLALAAVVALVAIALPVMVVGARSPELAPVAPGEPPTLPPAIRVALDLEGEGRYTDAATRTAAVRDMVLPSRAVAFLAELDRQAAAADRWRSVAVSPVAYRVDDSGPDDARVLVLSRVVRVADDGTTSTSWEVSGYGVIRQWERWWVFSYAGTSRDHEPDDDELADFVPVWTEV